MKIIQIVGYKNSGKTTFTSMLIEYLTRKGIRCAALKHHGHGGPPVGLDRTDSEKHRKAGAILSGVQGEDLLQLSFAEGWNLDKILAIYELFDYQVLVMEGYKNEDFNKILLINSPDDLGLVDSCMNVKGILTTLENQYLKEIKFPVFQKSNHKVCLQWIYEKLVLKD